MSQLTAPLMGLCLARALSTARSTALSTAPRMPLIARRLPLNDALPLIASSRMTPDQRADITSSS